MQGKERRKFPRYPLITEIQYISDSPVITGRTSDISIGGIFVDTVNPLDIGAVVKFRFTLPESPPGKPIVGEGRVTWRQETVGMGILFTRMGKEDWGRIQRFVKKLAAGKAE